MTEIADRALRLTQLSSELLYGSLTVTLADGDAVHIYEVPDTGDHTTYQARIWHHGGSYDDHVLEENDDPEQVISAVMRRFDLDTSDFRSSVDE